MTTPLTEPPRSYRSLDGGYGTNLCRTGTQPTTFLIFNVAGKCEKSWTLPANGTLSSNLASQVTTQAATPTFSAATGTYSSPLRLPEYANERNGDAAVGATSGLVHSIATQVVIDRRTSNLMRCESCPAVERPLPKN